MSNTVMMKALPIVAAALGKKHGVKVVIREGASTASTDGKTIYLPVLPDTPLSLVLARGYIDHECAHVRYTDFTVGLGSGLKHALINILEDIRIEQQLGSELPGCKINLAALEKAFIETGMYDVVSSKSHPAEILVARMHHCLRVEVLKNECTTDLANNAKEMFYKTFPSAMTSEIDKLLLEANALRDTQHVADLADRILTVIQKDQPQQPSPPSQPQGGDGEKSESNDQQSSKDSSGNEDKESESGEKDEGAGSEKSDSNSNDSAEKGSEGDQSSNGSSGTDDDSNDPQSGTDTGSAGENGEGLSSDDADGADKSTGGSGNDQGNDNPSESKGSQSPGEEGGESSSPTEQQVKNQKELKETMDLDVVNSSDLGDKIAQALSSLSFTAQGSGQSAGTFPDVGKPLTGRPITTSEAARETTALRTRLFGLIQASKLKRSPPRRNGTRIDTSSLHKLRTGDTRVFRSSEMRRGINTGVVILLDQSSSMAHMKKDATKAAMAVAIALDTIPGVKLAVAGFGSVSNHHTGSWDPIVRPMKLFSQRLDRNGFVPVAQGGTPIAEALWWASSELLGLQSVQRRIVITITDGQPQDANAVRELVGRMTHASIENTAIGIGIRISPNLFPNNCSISHISDLPEQVFRMLQDMLVER